MNLHYTQYPIIKQMAREIGFCAKNGDLNLLALPGVDAHPGPIQIEDFDVCWVDCSIPAEALAKLKSYQRISQYPGIQAISNKNKLARNLLKMRSTFPAEYDFFPHTYLLPIEYNELRRTMQHNNRRDFYILKPEALC